MSEKTAALVTGASSGIGRALAVTLAEHGHDLLLTARRGPLLEQLARDLADAHGRRVLVREADLADPAAPAALAEWARESGLEVGWLVNNAGYGGCRPFAELERDHQLGMIAVNVAALVDLTHRLLPPMLHCGAGRILNVASTAAFQPGPYMAVYFATKAFVLSFSEALARELCGTGVRVTALCPGPTRTAFNEVAGMPDSRFVSRMGMSAERVARAGYRGAARGKAVVVPGVGNRLGAFMPRLLPRSWVRGVIARFQEGLRK